jgi:predicted ATPase
MVLRRRDLSLAAERPAADSRALDPALRTRALQWAADFAREQAAARSVRVVATSREPLRIGGEHIYDLPPLAVPADGVGPDIEVVDAIDLFVARARSADNTFALADNNAADIAQIVRQLDGLPQSGASQERARPRGDARSCR